MDSNKKVGTLIKTYLGKRVTSNNDVHNSLMLIYRDKDGEKQVLFYDEPKMDYYTLKDKSSSLIANPAMYVPFDKLEKHTVLQDNLYRDVAAKTDTLAFYDRVLFNYNRPYERSYNFKNLLKNNMLYNADMDIQDFYISKFYKEYEPDPKYKIHKSYLDIETDLMPDGNPKSFVGFPHPEDAPCPICLITFIDESSMTVHTFILRNKLNTALTEFEKTQTEFESYMQTRLFSETQKQFKVKLYFFDYEGELIKNCFKVIHEFDPDYCGIWNNSFDIVTIQNRLKKLYDKSNDGDRDVSSYQQVNDALCDSKYFVHTSETGKSCYLTPTSYFREGFGNIGRKMNTYTVLDGIQWVDQELLYAITHVSGGKLDSYSLDYVSNLEVGAEKLPFAQGETYKNLIWKNPRKFVEYNIIDVVLLYKIENKTNDMNTLQTLSEITDTRHDSVFKKSVSLTNFVNKYAASQGLAMRTNKNARYGDESDYYNNTFLTKGTLTEYDPEYLNLLNRKDKYGAYVSNPNLMNKVGVKLFDNTRSDKIFEYVCDEDFSSLYPSIIRTFNLDAMNIVGKFYCIDKDRKARFKDLGYGDIFKLSNKGNDKPSSQDDVGLDVPDDDDDAIISKKDSVDETDDIGLVLADSIISENWNKVGELFFDLPTIESMVTELKSSVNNKNHA